MYLERTFTAHDATIRVSGTIPTCITVNYWKRHDLSKHDIECILSYIPTKMVWVSAILHGLSSPWFVFRSSSSSRFTITMVGKMIAVDQLLSYTHLKLSRRNQLDTVSVDSFEHIPPIPTHSISAQDYEYIYKGVVSHLLPRRLMVPGEVPGSIPLLYTYKDVQWVPVGIEGSSICCNAVCTEKHYKTHYNHAAITHEPMVGEYKKVVYVLTDELILFTHHSFHVDDGAT